MTTSSAAAFGNCSEDALYFHQTPYPTPTEAGARTVPAYPTHPEQRNLGIRAGPVTAVFQMAIGIDDRQMAPAKVLARNALANIRNSHAVRPTANGRIAFSARLLFISRWPSYRNVTMAVLQERNQDRPLLSRALDPLDRYAANSPPTAAIETCISPRSLEAA